MSAGTLGEGGMRADHIGQRVKVCWPGPDTVYGNGPAYVSYDASGYITAARAATDAEVQWWLALKQSEFLASAMQSLENQLRELAMYGIKAHT